MARKIEIFSAECTVCDVVVAQVRAAACPSCDVTVVRMSDTSVARRAKSLGIRSLPAVVIDGKVADCCSARGVDIGTLKSLGLGRA